MPATNAKPAIFYGYIIVAAGFLIMAVMWGAAYTFGIFLKPLSEDFGWSRAVTSGSYSMFMFVFGLLCILTGRLTDRFGPRLIITVCSILLGAGFILMSRVSTLWQLYLIYGLVIAAGASGSTVPLVSTVARWFVRRRGMMSGIVLSGVGGGVMIGPPVAEWLISSYDWPMSYLAIGVVTLAALTLLAQLIRKDPGEAGRLVDSTVNAKAVLAPAPAESSLTEALHTRNLWLLVQINLFWGIILASVLVHLAPHATDHGISAASAANALAIIGGVHIIGRLVMCGFADRIGSKLALAIGYGWLTIAMSALLFARELWAFYLFAAIFGFSYGGLGALPTLMVAELFGIRTHGAILGIIFFAWAVGGVAGPFVTGYIFDIGGSYYPAFLALLLLSVAGIIITSLVKMARSNT